ncbi:MAG: ammonium transporter [Acidimicrobiia bacterium]|nr:ammonium transporter [Acidimicrobiia bacterium]
MERGDVTWILVSAALVLFMVPGLALFYGGMSRSKNVLNMLMMNMVCLGVVPIVWVVVGYTLAFGGDSSPGLIGNLDHLFFRGVDIGADGTGELLLFSFFALTFAVITPALISGAVADRLRFGAWVALVVAWSVIVFAPTFHWIYGPNGWLAARGGLDFAGGTVVHVSAGAASMAVILLLGKRRGWPGEPMPPHSLPLTMLGAGILWFGWFGFNAGSAGAAEPQAIQAFVNTFIAAAAGMCTWLLAERARNGHATSLGAASGVVAGLVAITPGAGFLGTWSALVVGALAGVVCFFAISVKYRLGYDDALDVVGVHFVGGLLGGVLIGVFADPAVVSTAGVPEEFDAGLLAGGGAGLLVEQIIANVVVMVYSFVGTLAIAKVIDLVIGLRVDPDDEARGLDQVMHAETGYNL